MPENSLIKNILDGLIRIILVVTLLLMSAWLGSQIQLQELISQSNFLGQSPGEDISVNSGPLLDPGTGGGCPSQGGCYNIGEESCQNGKKYKCLNYSIYCNPKGVWRFVSNECQSAPPPPPPAPPPVSVVPPPPPPSTCGDRRPASDFQFTLVGCAGYYNVGIGCEPGYGIERKYDPNTLACTATYRCSTSVVASCLARIEADQPSVPVPSEPPENSPSDPIIEDAADINIPLDQAFEFTCGSQGLAQTCKVDRSCTVKGERLILDNSDPDLHLMSSDEKYYCECFTRDTYNCVKVKAEVEVPPTPTTFTCGQVERGGEDNHYCTLPSTCGQQVVDKSNVSCPLEAQVCCIKPSTVTPTTQTPSSEGPTQLCSGSNCLAENENSNQEPPRQIITACLLEVSGQTFKLDLYDQQRIPAGGNTIYRCAEGYQVRTITCGVNQYISANTCIDKKTDGSQCGSDYQCQSAKCGVDITRGTRKVCIGESYVELPGGGYAADRCVFEGGTIPLSPAAGSTFISSNRRVLHRCEQGPDGAPTVVNLKSCEEGYRAVMAGYCEKILRDQESCSLEPGVQSKCNEGLICRGYPIRDTSPKICIQESLAILGFTGDTCQSISECNEGLICANYPTRTASKKCIDAATYTQATAQSTNRAIGENCTANSQCATNICNEDRNGDRICMATSNSQITCTGGPDVDGTFQGSCPADYDYICMASPDRLALNRICVFDGDTDQSQVIPEGIQLPTWTTECIDTASRNRTTITESNPIEINRYLISNGIQSEAFEDWKRAACYEASRDSGVNYVPVVLTDNPEEYLGDGCSGLGIENNRLSATPRSNSAGTCLLNSGELRYFCEEGTVVSTLLSCETKEYVDSQSGVGRVVTYTQEEIIPPAKVTGAAIWAGVRCPFSDGTIMIGSINMCAQGYDDGRGFGQSDYEIRTGNDTWNLPINNAWAVALLGTAETVYGLAGIPDTAATYDRSLDCITGVDSVGGEVIGNDRASSCATFVGEGILAPVDVVVTIATGGGLRPGSSAASLIADIVYPEDLAAAIELGGESLGIINRLRGETANTIALVGDINTTISNLPALVVTNSFGIDNAYIRLTSNVLSTVDIDTGTTGLVMNAYQYHLDKQSQNQDGN